MDTNLQQPSLLQKVTESVKGFEKSTLPIVLPKYSEPQSIIDDLVSCVRPVNFDDIAMRETEKKANVMQKIVIIIDELILLAKKHNRSIMIMYGQIFIYNGIFWQILNENDTKLLLGRVAEKMGYELFGSRFFATKERLFKQLQSSAYATLETLDNNTETVLINFKNCTLEITESLITPREHKAEDKLTYCLPYVYDSEAKCELFSKFLDETLPNFQSQTVLLEYLGYVFTKHLKLEKVLILHGDGKNGKSVVYDIVCKLLGEENVSNFSLEEVTKDKGYCRIKLAYKKLNYGSDINDRIDAVNFKKMSSGEPILARNIHCEPIEMTDYAKQMYNTNQLPNKGAEATTAFFRRFIIIPFSVTIDDKDINVNLSKEICETDLPGIFNLVLLGLQKVLKEKKFTECDEVDDALCEFAEEINPISDFIMDRDYVQSTEVSISLQDLYRDYKKFCNDSQTKFVGSKVFSKLLQRQCGFRVERPGGNARQVYIKKQTQI